MSTEKTMELTEKVLTGLLPNTMSIRDTVIDVDLATTTGFFPFSKICQNTPVAYGIMIVLRTNGYIAQLCVSTSGKLFIRFRDDGASGIWTAWQSYIPE